MWSARYRPFFSGLTGSSISSSPSCKNCTRKRWLLGTEGLFAIGGICSGTPLALKGQPVWVKAACTTGALCIFLANSALHIPVNTPSSWMCMFTGGILSGAGIGWCLTVAFKERPNSTIVAYLAGVISICLTNSIVFHEKVSSPGDDGKQPEESLATREVTTQNGSHCQQVNCYERESIGKKSPDTGTEVKESNLKCRENTLCNVKFPANDKSVVRSKQQGMVTSGRRIRSVSESLESHLQGKSTPTDFTFRRNSDETDYISKEKIMSVKENAQRVSVASRFQDMCSAVRTSGMASNLFSSTVAVVVPVDNCSGGDGDDEATDVDEVVRVKSLSKVIDHSQKSENLSTSSGSPDESAKGVITQYVRLLESTDEYLSVEN